jgi:hypothetical protein
MGLTSQIIATLFQKPSMMRISPSQGRQRIRVESCEENILSGAKLHRVYFLTRTGWIFLARTPPQKKAKMLIKKKLTQWQSLDP